jgi:endonuclease/exonuclease/phosphatase family metal-dependent hydrolase
MKADHEEIAPARSANNQHLVAELNRFATFAEFRKSNVYRARRAELSALLDEPKIHLSREARPRLKSFLRVVAWNIERGSRLAGIIEALNEHPILRFADLLLLNELDDGMARSGNRAVALELSRALQAHAIYGVEYLELTKGPSREPQPIADNTAALHGNAIITRHAFSNPQLVRLARCENNFESEEKRIGGRLGILVDLEINDSKLLAATTHLDVVNTPRCRAAQMRTLLEAIEAHAAIASRSGHDARRVIVGGDFNTHTFARGGRLRTMKNTAVILGSNPDSLRRRLLNPQKKEAALRELARFGYEIGALNDRRATSRALVSGLDDKARLPAAMRSWVNDRVGPEGLLLELRLDWLAARGVAALKAGEIIDAETGVASINSQTIQGLNDNGSPISDHDPIVADLAIG